MESRSAARKLPRRGLMKVGPSEDYKALLRGEIKSEEYVRRIKADLEDDLDWLLSTREGLAEENMRAALADSAATTDEFPPCPKHGEGFICDHDPEEDYADEWD